MGTSLLSKAMTDQNNPTPSEIVGTAGQAAQQIGDAIDQARAADPDVARHIGSKTGWWIRLAGSLAQAGAAIAGVFRRG